MGLYMNMDNISSLAHMNICTQSKTGPMLSFLRNTTILHMGSTDNYNIICYMGSEGNIQYVQASLLKGEGMRMPSMSSEQTAAPATPSTFIAPKLQAMPSKATAAAAQPA
jgi:hypothetical protein